MEAVQTKDGKDFLNRQDSKFLTFNLDNNIYGIPILKVSEIIGITQITPIPKSPYYIKGVINLRGKIIPVIDLRLKLDMQQREYDQNTCIIIINLELEKTIKQIGIIVDIVSEVCNIDTSDIDSSTDYGSVAENNLLSGIGKIKEKVVMLLNIEEVMYSQELLNILKEVKK